jgi:hypothetical protein
MSRAGLRGWAIIGVPRYPGYITPIVAAELFIEQVARAVGSTGGRINTHMLLWVLSQDQVMTMEITVQLES